MQEVWGLWTVKFTSGLQISLLVDRHNVFHLFFYYNLVCMTYAGLEIFIGIL